MALMAASSKAAPPMPAEMMPGATALTVMPAARDLETQRLGGRMQRSLRRGVIHLAAIAGSPATEVMLMIRPQRVRIMGSIRGWVTL